MKLHLIGIWIALSLLAIVNAGPPKCPKNEIQRCVPACSPTCQNKNPLEKSTEPCTKKCGCKDGYLREGPGGKCVPKACKGVKICKKDLHEVFSACLTCERLCDDLTPINCSLSCQGAGCVCEKGYIRCTKGGKCITQKECDKKTYSK